MINDITNQIRNINEAIEWIRVNRPDHYEQRFLQLVSERSRLRKIAATDLENPAIAAYGESQKGKSYVVTNLLSDNGSPFTVKSPDGEYDFVKEINPITNNVEATGIVTRFTTFSSAPERYSPQYPVLVKLLSVAEIATILCDGYHNDVTDYQTYSDSELSIIAENIYNTYRDKPEIADAPVNEDDILDMKEYLQRATGASTQSLIRSPYFDRVALVARKIPAEKWTDVFAPLWHKNETLSQLFSRLTTALGRLGNVKEARLPISAVLNNSLTLMSVQRIGELSIAAEEKTSPQMFTDVAIRDSLGRDSIVSHFDKSELSALCAEAVFKIEERFLHSTLTYDTSMISPDVMARIGCETFSKNLLSTNDLLDFPGARARNQLKEENLGNTDSKSQMANDAGIYLRGKVAYLFNRYSDSGLINTLLFCHDNAQRSDDNLYITIENWIKKYVGDTPQSRQKTIQLAGGISPFFLVATKFNIDMAMGDINPDDVTNSTTAINQRWTDRFDIVLYKEVIHGNDADWFQNWTKPGETFNNTFLLRDYKYSADNGKGNNLYTGFATTGRESASALPSGYYNRMRQSFIESEATGRFFSDPEAAWDAAATINNDGALYLFSRLATVAFNTRNTRKELTRSILKQISSNLYDILKGYYHAEDAASQLLSDMNRACAIRREMIFASNADNYFFGRMIDKFQTSEQEIYNCIYPLINSPELTAKVNSADNYELIRKDVGTRLDRCSNDNDNAQKWECLMITWGLPDREAVAAYLASRNVDADKLFSGSYRPRQNSVIIADKVFETWIQSLKSALKTVTDGTSFDPIEMSALIDNIRFTAKKVDLPGRLEQQIADTVNVMNVSTVNIALIADIIASTINRFVEDLGYSYRSADEISGAEKIINDNPMRFDPPEYINRSNTTPSGEEQLTALFNRLYTNPDAVTPAFELNYYRWLEYMTFSFLMKGEIIDYDVNANKRLGALLEKIAH